MNVRRREFITLLGGAAAAWPLAANAQQAVVPVIGFLSSTSAWEGAPMADAFRRGLGDLGYAEGRNVLIDYRYAEGHYDRLSALAEVLARRPVAVIAALGTPAAPAARAVTGTIPIVFRIGVDPVELGLVESLGRPGGNLTGVVTLNVEIDPKRLEILHELIPNMKIAALLLNPANPNTEGMANSMRAAAGILGLQLQILQARSDSDFDGAFATMAERKVEGLVISSDPLFGNRNDQLAMLALRHKLPVITTREFAAAGGLVGYGGENSEAYRLTGVYAGRILKGARPADLPVQQLSKIELAINLKTAKTLGLTVPITLLGRADEVIE
jgi:putative ABC transport system substrate-binding protein